MTTKKPTSWKSFVTALTVFGVGAIIVVWRVSLPALDRQIVQKQKSLKSLYLKGSLPPDHEVVDYLNARQHALDTQYRLARESVMPPLAGNAQTDSQVHFQQRVHEVRRTIERMAETRKMDVPEQLGFPKELPPPDAVNRFLIQIELMEQLTALVMPVPGVSRLASLKIEDPSDLAADAQAEEALRLMQLPVRVRLRCSLEALATILNLLHRATPLVDIQRLRVAQEENVASETGTVPAVQKELKELEVELLVARYLVQEPETSSSSEKSEKPQKSQKSPRKRTTRESKEDI